MRKKFIRDPRKTLRHKLIFSINHRRLVIWKEKTKWFNFTIQIQIVKILKYNYLLKIFYQVINLKIYNNDHDLLLEVKIQIIKV